MASKPIPMVQPYLDKGLKVARIDFSGLLKGSAFLVDSYVEDKLLNHSARFDRYHSLHIDRGDDMIYIGRVDQPPHVLKEAYGTFPPPIVHNDPDTNEEILEQRGLMDYDRFMTVYGKYMVDSDEVLSASVDRRVSAYSYIINHELRKVYAFNIKDYELGTNFAPAPLESWGDTPQDAALNRELARYIVGRYGLTLDEEQMPISYTAGFSDYTDGYNTIDMPNNMVIVPAIGLGFVVTQTIPGFLASAMSLVSFAGAKSTVKYFSKDNRNLLNKAARVRRRFDFAIDNVTLGVNSEIWHPVSGCFELLTWIGCDSIRQSTEVMAWEGNPEIKVFTVDVVDIQGSVDSEQITAYYKDVFGIQPKNKPITEEQFSYWKKFGTLDFYYGDRYFADGVIDLERLTVAKEYNKRRVKACKTPNFLDLEYKNGKTWREVQSLCNSAPRVNMWISDAQESGLSDWALLPDDLRKPMAITKIQVKLIRPGEHGATVEMFGAFINGNHAFSLPKDVYFGDRLADDSEHVAAINNFLFEFVTLRTIVLSDVDRPPGTQDFIDFLEGLSAILPLEEDGSEPKLDLSEIVVDGLQVRNEWNQITQSGPDSYGIGRASNGPFTNRIDGTNQDGGLMMLCKNVVDYAKAREVLKHVLNVTMTPNARTVLSDEMTKKYVAQ